MLVELTLLVELVADVLVEEVELLTVVVVLLVVVVVIGVVVVTIWLAEPGGSRCSMKLRVFGIAVTPVPTANPFVLDRSDRLLSSPLLGMGGVRDVTVQLAPS